MKRFPLLGLALSACTSLPQLAPVSLPAPQPVQPVAAPPSPAPAPAVVQAPKPAPDSVPAHVRVLIPSELVYWMSPDQRFSQDLVAGQPVMVNAICDSTKPFPMDRTYITKGDGNYLDYGSCKSVAKGVVDEWFYAWNVLARANPSWTPKQIQDAISAGAY